MKALRITLAILSFIAVSGLSSCKKKCNGPHEHKGKHECHHHADDSSSTPTATASAGT